MRGSKWITLLAVGIVIAAFLVYKPALDAGFYLDDIGNIHEVPELHWEELSIENLAALDEAGRNHRRVIANLTLGLNHLVGGRNPFGYHLVNILIHLLVGLVLVWVAYLYASGAAPVEVARRRSLHAALAASSVFLLHPLNTQAVTYVIQRMSALAALFSLVAFGCYLVGRRSWPDRKAVAVWALGGLSWLLALGSKENALALPLVILCFEYCFYRASWRSWFARRSTAHRWLILASVVFLAVTAVFLLSRAYPLPSLKSLTENFGRRGFNGLERVMTQARVHLLYLTLMLLPLPSRLTLDHEFTVSRSLLDPPSTLFALLFWLVVIVGLVWLARRAPRYAFPGLAYLALHSIESGPVNLELVFEHRMYLPMTALVLLLAAVLADLEPRHFRPALAITLSVALVLAVLTYRRNLTWIDPVEFHQDLVAKAPGKARTHNNLGANLFHAGQFTESEAAFRRALELDPKNYETHVGLSRTLGALGRDEEAEEFLRQAVQLEPGSQGAWIDLGNRSRERGDLESALQLFTRAVAAGPQNPGARYSLGVVLLDSGRFEQAVRELEIAQRLDPSFAPTYRALGDAYRESGRLGGAMVQYRAAIERDLEDSASHLALGTLLGQQGQISQAIYHLEIATKLEPDNSEAYNNLGNAYFQAGQLAEAIEQYRASLEHDPTNEQARFNLEMARRRMGSTSPPVNP